MTQRGRTTPIPADFFFGNPTRSMMTPTLVAAMTLAYQWCELIGSNDQFLTEAQLLTAFAQISAHGIDARTVIRDLLALNQLNDVGTGYQLPQLHTTERRRARADAERRRYHERKAERQRKSGRRGRSPQSGVRHARPETTYGIGGFPPFEPESGVRWVDQDPESLAHESGRQNQARTRTHTSPSHSAEVSSRSERSDHTGTSERYWSRSGLGASADQTKAERAEPEPVAQSHSDPTAAQSGPADTSAAPAPDFDTRWRTEASADTQELVDELVDKIGKPCVSLPEASRGRLLPRAEYAPPPRLLAEWVTRMPLSQILKDLDRYHRRGKDDVIAVRQHDSVFDSFMWSTMGYKSKTMAQRLRTQQAMRAVKRQHRESNPEFYKNLSWDKMGISPDRYLQMCREKREKEARDKEERMKREHEASVELDRAFQRQRDAERRAAVDAA